MPARQCPEHEFIFQQRHDSQNGRWCPAARPDEACGIFFVVLDLLRPAAHGLGQVLYLGGQQIDEDDVEARVAAKRLHAVPLGLVELAVEDVGDKLLCRIRSLRSEKFRIARQQLMAIQAQGCELLWPGVINGLGVLHLREQERELRERQASGRQQPFARYRLAEECQQRAKVKGLALALRPQAQAVNREQQFDRLLAGQAKASKLDTATHDEEARMHRADFA